MSHKLLSIILEADKNIYPLTNNRSVSAIPVAGKYRLVDIPISNCLHAGIGRMFILTQFNAASLNRHIKNTYHFSSFSQAFVDILSAEQTPESKEWYQGSADAVRKCLRYISPFKARYLMVLPADQFYQMDFSKMLENHIRLKADISIATHAVSETQTKNKRIFKLNSEGYISGFTDDADNLDNWGNGENGSVKKYATSMGIYIFNRKILFDLLEKFEKKANDFRAEIIPAAIKRFKVAGYLYENYCSAIQDIHSFLDANLALTEMVPSFDLFDQNKSIYTRQRLLPPAKINNATMLNTLIAEGSIINDSYLEKCIVGIRSRIGAGSNIINSYIMGNDTFEKINHGDNHNNLPLMGVGKNCRLKNVVMDKNVRMGDNVIIEADRDIQDIEGDFFVIKDGIAVIKEGSIVPEGFRL